MHPMVSLYKICISHLSTSATRPANLLVHNQLTQHCSVNRLTAVFFSIMAAAAAAPSLLQPHESHCFTGCRTPLFWL